ncbi:hypothetical protein MRX96_008473 [Rhipicephalus microplus]
MRACCGEIKPRGGERRSRGDKRSQWDIVVVGGGVLSTPALSWGQRPHACRCRPYSVAHSPSVAAAKPTLPCHSDCARCGLMRSASTECPLEHVYQCIACDAILTSLFARHACPGTATNDPLHPCPWCRVLYICNSSLTRHHPFQVQTQVAEFYMRLGLQTLDAL